MYAFSYYFYYSNKSKNKRMVNYFDLQKRKIDSFPTFRYLSNSKNMHTGKTRNSTPQKKKRKMKEKLKIEKHEKVKK
jgi:hypothetical protein